jgi:hypothetical protein
MPQAELVVQQQEHQQQVQTHRLTLGMVVVEAMVVSSVAVLFAEKCGRRCSLNHQLVENWWGHGDGAVINWLWWLWWLFVACCCLGCGGCGSVAFCFVVFGRCHCFCCACLCSFGLSFPTLPFTPFRENLESEKAQDSTN